MFSIDKKIGISGGRVVAYTQQTPRTGNNAQSVSRLHTASSAPSQSVSSAGAANMSVSDGFLTGLFPEQPQQQLKAIHDCYTYDAISGTAVDLNSSLPFCPFSLYGVDEEKLDVYNSAIASLNIRAYAEQMTRQFLVDGAYCSTLVFDAKTLSFVDQIPYEFECLHLEKNPLASQDPIITVKVPKRITDFLSETSEQHNNVRKMIPTKMQDLLRSGEFTLDPLSTLFLARRPFLTSDPVSYLRRVLPAYLIEKTLYRGTLFESGRRQRANVHVTAGDDGWEPTPEELSSIANIFQQTDLDPMGAIVVTRNGIQVNDFRQAGDFWKWTDVFDQLTTVKLKALGISDAFLSSESTYSNAESALVVFMENLQAYRDYFTHTVFTNKLFPMIATLRGFRKDGKNQPNSPTSALRSANNYNDLEIPSVRWHKRLTAGNDTNLFDALEKLSEKGIPVPYRLWLAASNVDVDTLLNELEDDGKLRGKLDSFAKADDPADSMMGELASLKPRKHWSMQDFGNLSDAHTEDSQGRRRFAMNQRAAHRRINEKIVKATAALASPEDYYRVKQKIMG